MLIAGTFVLQWFLGAGGFFFLGDESMYISFSNLG